jgi:hypothetical protein
VDVDKLAAALAMPPPADRTLTHPLGDLVLGGLAVVAAFLAR